MLLPEVIDMECVVLADTQARRTALQWALEDLGEDWRCVPFSQAEQALRHLQARPVELAVLAPGEASSALLDALRTQPLLAPPYLLGDGFPAPDGPLPPLPELPGLLAHRRCTGGLPALCPLRQPEAEALARGLLHALGVPQRLRAWAFLPEMVALTAVHPPLMDDLSHRLYPLIARRYGMTPAAIERSLRLCVESTWSRGELARLERFFGSSVDPDRGKPTNREFLCRLQERVTLASRRLRR